MPATSSENNESIIIKESLPKDNFFKELKRWRNGLMSSEVMTLDDVLEKSLDIEQSMDISEDDSGLMAIASDMFGLVKLLGRTDVERSNYKTQSVEIQQTAVEEVLSRFHNGKFDDEKAPDFFYAMTEVFNKLKDQGFIAEKFCVLSGLRGMISAALLFSKAGFEVELPCVNWDAYHDIDLIASKKAKYYSISVKSVIGNHDTENGKPFCFETRPEPSDMNEDYRDLISKHLWINVPNMNTADGERYCDNTSVALAIGLPSEKTTEEFLKCCRDKKIPE